MCSTIPADNNRRDSFQEAVDQSPGERNENYRAHRSGEYVLDMPELRLVKEGTLAGVTGDVVDTNPRRYGRDG